MIPWSQSRAEQGLHSHHGGVTAAPGTWMLPQSCYRLSPITFYCNYFLINLSPTSCFFLTFWSPTELSLGLFCSPVLFYLSTFHSYLHPFLPTTVVFIVYVLVSLTNLIYYVLVTLFMFSVTESPDCLPIRNDCSWDVCMFHACSGTHC